MMTMRKKKCLFRIFRLYTIRQLLKSLDLLILLNIGPIINMNGTLIIDLLLSAQVFSFD